jgi:pimeloyl-ACP methyl ester carboxylesterase
MKQELIAYKSSQISYCRFGFGPNVALCFHGYGEEATSFAFLDKYAGNQYTFYSIDLPFHGKTEWNNGLIFTHADLQQIVEKIIGENNLSLQTPNFKLTLIGFSLGGRVALSFLQAHPEKVEKLILLAPDGLKVNFWYWLATQTSSGNKFFAFTLKHPGWFFRFLKIMNKLRLVNASIFKFVNYYIGDVTVRRLLYQRWTTLRKLKPNLALIKSYIQKENIPVRLIYGKHDRIILSSVGEKFKKGIEEQCKLSVIHSGHQVLHEKHAVEIVDSLSGY